MTALASPYSSVVLVHIESSKLQKTKQNFEYNQLLKMQKVRKSSLTNERQLKQHSRAVPTFKRICEHSIVLQRLASNSSYNHRQV